MQTVPTDISSLCSSGHTPLILTGVMLWLCREHFGDENNIEAELLKDKVWTDDLERTSGIWIDVVGRWDAKKINRRPAVVVKRNNMVSSEITIGDLSHGGIDREGDHYLRMCQGSHTMFCLGETDAEAELLSAETYRYFMHWSPVLHEELRLHKLDFKELGAVGRLKESKEHFAAPVQVEWAFVDSWTMKPEAPLLRQIVIDMQLKTVTEESNG